MKDTYLIVGLGNIGKEYENTRHNLGFRVLDALAEKYETSFFEKKVFKGKLGQIEVEKKKVFLLKPTTFMNNSGEATKAVINFFKIDISNILVITDDVDIPFGECRLKKKSGSGGHKGLRSIEKELNSNEYARLKIGIGRDKDLVSYVLGRFSQEEENLLGEVIKRSIQTIHLWLLQGVEIAMNQVNRKKEVDNG